MGAHETVNNRTEDAKERVLGLTEGFGADVVFEVVGGGAPTMNLAVSLARNGGAIGIVGVFSESLDDSSMENIRRFEKELIGIASCSYWGNRTEFSVALDAMESGEVDVNSLITHQFPLRQINEAFDTAKNPLKTGAIKVLVIP
jgi:threonine dehydrogenase-like Zn-dependent dehydrogenase